MNKKTIQITLGLSLSALFLWLAFRNVPMARLGESLKAARYEWIIPVILFQILAVLARSYRWKILLGQKSPFSLALWAQGIGYMLTNIFPLRAGEIARIWVVHHKGGMPAAYVAGTAVVERLMDLCFVLLGLGVSVAVMNVPPRVKSIGVTFTFMSALLMGACFFFAKKGEWVGGLLKKWEAKNQLLNRINLSSHLVSLQSGFHFFSDRKLAVQVILWSLISWIFSVGVYWAVLKAFVSSAKVIEALFSVVALSLAIAAPSSPGFIGIYQFIGQQSLVIPFGVKYSLETALSIAMVAHIVFYGITTLAGVIGLWRLKISIRSVKRNS